MEVLQELCPARTLLRCQNSPGSKACPWPGAGPSRRGAGAACPGVDELTHPPLEYRSTLGLVTGNHPVPCPMEPWVWGWGANHSPLCSCSPGGRGARWGSKAWACPRVSRWISAEPKGATFGPKALVWVGPAPTSGGGAGTESGRGLLHSRATLAPQCYIRDRAEP